MREKEMSLLAKDYESDRTIKQWIYVITKRTFDILISIFGIIFTFILFIPIKFISILNKDYSPILFKQRRIGLNGKTFVMYKFRTMRPDADKILKRLLETNDKIRNEYNLNKKLKNDPRITKIGKVLRKLSLDEFPQFINIFKGDMSLVGNRPYIPREMDDMKQYYADIIKTKPGLTGYWQTNGRSNTSFQHRLEMEQEYSKIQSFSLDVSIIFKTILQFFKNGGAM